MLPAFQCIELIDAYEVPPKPELRLCRRLSFIVFNSICLPIDVQ